LSARRPRSTAPWRSWEPDGASRSLTAAWEARGGRSVLGRHRLVDRLALGGGGLEELPEPLVGGLEDLVACRVVQPVRVLHAGLAHRGRVEPFGDLRERRRRQMVG